MAYVMSATSRPRPSLHNLLIMWAAILVVCSTVVTATSSTVDNQNKGHFKKSTTPTVPDHNEERTLWTCVEGLVELFNNFDNFLIHNYPFKASMVDVYLKNTGLNFQARDSFMSQEFEEAVDKILALHSNDHMLAQKAMFEGLQRATRAEDQTDMFSELGRTIGSYKPVTSTPSSPRIHGTESFERRVEMDEGLEKQMRFVLGLERHLLKYWVKYKYPSGAVWKSLKLDVRRRDEFRNPSFCVYIDYITYLEPHEFVRYDKALHDVRHWSDIHSFKPIPDLVIAQQLVDAGAPNNADVATTHLMQALFRDWEKQKMTHDELFRKLLPYFTSDLESLLQGPLKLWIEYFGGTENPAGYKMLLQTILKSAKKIDPLVDDRNELLKLHDVEDRLVRMFSPLMRDRPQFPDTASRDLVHISKLFVQEILRPMKRDGVTAKEMLSILEIRELKHNDLLQNPRLWTWMSFVIDSYGEIKNFESADPEELRIIALVKRDGNTMFDHLKEHLTDGELVTLVEKAIGWDERLYYLFASNLANMWKSEKKTSHDVFLLLGLDVPVETLLTMDKFPLWFNFVIEFSQNEVEATLEMHLILKVMYDKESTQMPEIQRPNFDKVIKNAMSATVDTRPKLCQCISKLWCVDMLNTGNDDVRYHINDYWMMQFYDRYVSTHSSYYEKKLSVSLPAGFN